MYDRILMAGFLVVLATALLSCGGGGSSYGGGGGMVVVAPPAAFTLTSPADAATGTGTTPTLTWAHSLYATSYRVQVDTTGTFTGTLVINAMVGAGTLSHMVQPADNLVGGTQYFWRVIAANIYGQATAGPRSFTP
jgi:hypothetical protein